MWITCWFFFLPAPETCASAIPQSAPFWDNEPVHVPNLFPMGITNGNDVLDDIKQALKLLGGKFKPPPSFGSHFLSGRGQRWSRSAAE
jgi:hypothetical protein